jgi:excinuclease ABC subunit A
LLESLKTLQQRGNTVLVVEHDEAVIREADYRIEIGPGSGKYGGELVEEREQEIGDWRQEATKEGMSLASVAVLTLQNVATHNLKNITVSFPLQKLTCITGVSGSGKSSLINETLVPLVREQITGGRRREAAMEIPLASAVCHLPSVAAIDKLIEVDQTPLGKNSRSNPATYSGLFDELRKLFASTKDAKRRGYKASRFSFNAGGGRCEACQGLGTQKIETDFLSDYYIVCPTCNGKRFNRQTLAVKYKGKSIADVLDMSIEEAATFFENIPQINRILQAMLRIGLGYLALGQPSSMLSGGEAQRVKLATELAKPETGNTLYVLDEPTTGLHRSDVFRLLNVLFDLTKKGNTVIVTEHNLDVVAHADWQIDLGPEGGERGGYILATGAPKDIMAYLQ